MSREINYNKEARKKLQAGSDKIANAVKVTLGAKGRNVIIQREYGSPQVTKDGVTVANNIALPDPIENMGAEMVREAASRAGNSAGDGTTTSTILAQAIINESIKLIDHKSFSDRLLGKESVNPMDLKRGIDKGVMAVVEELRSMAEKVSHDNERIKQIATISANGDEEIGNLIADAMRQVTSDGIITIEESKNTKTFVDVLSGLRFVNGLLHPAFVTNQQKVTGEYDDVNILFFNGKISTTKEILPVIEMGLKLGKPLVIIAHDFDGEVILTFAKNRIEKGFKIIPIKSPAFGELRRDMTEDLAIFTGATIISEESGITPADFTEDMFGKASKLEVSKEYTTLVGGSPKEGAIQNRIANLRSQIDDKTQVWDDDEIKGRIAKLNGGVAVIYVGANTEVEMNEKKDRVDDALSATRSAVEEGIVAGGGIALIEASTCLEYLGVSNSDQGKGLKILKDALTAPLKQIASNSGLNVNQVYNRVVGLGYPNGYDAKEDDYGDLLVKGIIDPVKVTRVALESAASIATLILTSEATVSLIQEGK